MSTKAPSLKPLSQQVVVVLGASSGIGRASALELARRGAKLVVAARSEPGLVSLVEEITSKGGDATHAVCDVADIEQVAKVADTAIWAYGRIDTWVNAAAVSIYARFEDTTPAEFKRISEVNYLGQVHGALAGSTEVGQRGQGAIIAVSSVEAIVSLPLHAAYSASKHAVEGAMDTLRRDLMAEGVPISVTSVKPGTINTPFFNNARNKMDVKPQGPPPIYQPGVVADCVVYAAEHPVRDLFAGGSGRMMAISQFLNPKRTDQTLAKLGIRSERTSEPTPGGAPGTLDEPRLDDNRVEGDLSAKARRFSLYTFLQTHPRSRRVLSTGVLVTAPVLVARIRRERGCVWRKV
jgi:NAD(P)-dependent dehydrogenase (short-subunit alcohol dehydrogenase family)